MSAEAIGADEVCKQRENKNKKKRDALARNDVFWSGQFYNLIKFSSDYGRNRPCQARVLL
jgi:hypothetical protein